jgi:hypothetical protein
VFCQPEIHLGQKVIYVKGLAKKSSAPLLLAILTIDSPRMLYELAATLNVDIWQILVDLDL